MRELRPRSDREMRKRIARAAVLHKPAAGAASATRSSWVYFRSFSKPCSTISPVMMPSEIIRRSFASEDAALQIDIDDSLPLLERERFQDRERVGISLGVENRIAFL